MMQYNRSMQSPYGGTVLDPRDANQALCYGAAYGGYYHSTQHTSMAPFGRQAFVIVQLELPTWVGKEERGDRCEALSAVI